jgi:alkylation response protein AidB-like acyl-CoA dehydrogenase
VRSTIDFLLYDWLQVGSLTQRARFAEHSGETFASVLDTCERIARDKFAPFNRLVDTEEPRIDAQGRVVLPQATHDAWQAYASSGMLAAAQSEDWGGMNLPYVVEAAANAFFARASVSISAALLTVGNANLLLAHGTARQKEVFARAEFEGRWAGTMCLSEPQAGSSLSDVATRAVLEDEHDALGPRYRLTGHKMWISAGEHEITENIVHLVLAKIPGADGKLVAGTRGISLFIVPKHVVDAQGRLTGERNDVVLAGLNHKCGWRGTTNTLLNFGERGGAIGYLVGQPGEGLRCMFHMMNEARIGVGMAATMLGMAGYEAALDHAKQRPQGRPIGGGVKDASQPPVPIIEHADVKRMLLAQKAYAEGALALQLYCARLVDELLEVLTPIAKSWPSEWCLEGNSLAIQVHGGYGYTRDFPVEQYWRDQRLNMIHEGTHGIQALDLLGRKVTMNGGAGLKLLASRISATIERAGPVPGLAEQARALASALQSLGAATKAAWATGVPEEALANATPYLQAVGHTVLAWMWLDVALVTAAREDDQAQGQRAAMRYFFNFELPKIGAWLAVVSSRDATCREMREEWF